MSGRHDNSLTFEDETPRSSDTYPRLELKHLREGAHSPVHPLNNIVHQKPVPDSTKGEEAGDQLEARSEEPSTDAVISDARVPPDGGRIAWTQVFASFLINMNVYGLVNAFGDFQHFYETDYLQSYSSSTISWIGTVQGSLTLFIGALAGPLFDKGYFMITLRCASVILVFSWMMLSLSTQYYQIMLTQGILAGVCVGLMEVPSIALIPVYFRKRLGLALGLAISGAPAGGLIYSVVFRSVLNATNFGWATRVIGFVVLVSLGTAIIIIKPLDADRKSTTRKFFDLSAFRETPFIHIIICAFSAYCAALVPYFVTPAFAISLRESSSSGTYLIAVLNTAQFFGRIIPNWLSDYYGGGDMLLLSQTLIGVLGLHWITVATLGGFVEFLIFTGFISGAVATLPSDTIPYICPNPETLGTRIGMIYAAAGFGTLIGNPVALALTGNTSTREGFLGAQLWMGICALVSAVFFVIPARVAKRNRAVAFGSKHETKANPWMDLMDAAWRMLKSRH